MIKTQTLKIDKLNIRRGPKRLFAIEGLNVTFEKMQIVGANGCGKTTLLKHLKKKSDRYFNYDIGVVSQHPMLLKRLDIETNCKLLLEHEYNDLLEEYFLIFPNLTSSKIVSELSGGQTQILNILFNLHQRKDIYFIDEPFNNLDNENRKYVENKLSTLDANLIIIAHGYQLEFCDQRLSVENKQLKELNEATRISGEV